MASDNVRMRQFCFNLRDANNGNKLMGGTISGDSMEDCAVRIARRLQLVMEIESPERITERHVLWFKDRRVNLYITAIPEHVLSGKIPTFETRYAESLEEANPWRATT